MSVRWEGAPTALAATELTEGDITTIVVATIIGVIVLCTFCFICCKACTRKQQMGTVVAPPPGLSASYPMVEKTESIGMVALTAEGNDVKSVASAADETPGSGSSSSASLRPPQSPHAQLFGGASATAPATYGQYDASSARSPATARASLLLHAAFGPMAEANTESAFFGGAGAPTLSFADWGSASYFASDMVASALSAEAAAAASASAPSVETGNVAAPPGAGADYKYSASTAYESAYFASTSNTATAGPAAPPDPATSASATSADTPSGAASAPAVTDTLRSDPLQGVDDALRRESVLSELPRPSVVEIEFAMPTLGSAIANVRPSVANTDPPAPAASAKPAPAAMESVTLAGTTRTTAIAAPAETTRITTTAAPVVATPVVTRATASVGGASLAAPAPLAQLVSAADSGRSSRLAAPATLAVSATTATSRSAELAAPRPLAAPSGPLTPGGITGDRS